MSAIVIEVSDATMKRFEDLAAQEGTSVQAKALQLLESWVGRDTPSPEELERQVLIAKQELERYRNTFRELAR